MSATVDIDRLIFALPGMETRALRRLFEAASNEYHARLPPLDARDILGLLSRSERLSFEEPQEPANVAQWRARGEGSVGRRIDHSGE